MHLTLVWLNLRQFLNLNLHCSAAVHSEAYATAQSESWLWVQPGTLRVRVGQNSESSFQVQVPQCGVPPSTWSYETAVTSGRHCGGSVKSSNLTDKLNITTWIWHSCQCRGPIHCWQSDGRHPSIMPDHPCQWQCASGTVTRCHTGSTTSGSESQRRLST